MENSTQTWILTAHCPSVSGTVDVVTRYLASVGHYINEIQSFDDRATGQFLFVLSLFLLNQILIRSNLTQSLV